MAEGRAPRRGGKPTLYVMLPGRVAAPARQWLVERGLPYVDTLAEAMAVLHGWKAWSEYQEPALAIRPANMAPTAPHACGTLGEAAAKALLGEAGIPVNQERLAHGRRSRRCRQRAGLSGGAQDRLARHRAQIRCGRRRAGDHRHRRPAPATGLDAGQRAQAAPGARIAGYSLQRQEDGELELIVGARRDPQFGPQVLVGAGGVLVELLKDIAVLPAPIDAASARRALKVSRSRLCCVPTAVEGHWTRTPWSMPSSAWGGWPMI
jgi:acetyl-CoA synthetase (ADP-forming)